MTELATGLTSTDTQRLAQAEDVVRAWCGWHIAPVREAVATLDTHGASTLLILPTLKLVAVASVVSVTDDTVVAATSYELDDRGWLRRTDAEAWTAYPGRVTVTFTHGYEAPPPAVTAVVQALANRTITNPGALVRKQVGPFADTYSQTAANQVVSLALLDAEKDLLAPYQLPKRP